MGDAFVFRDIFHDTIKAEIGISIQPRVKNETTDEHDDDKVTRRLLSSSFNRRRRFIPNLPKEAKQLGGRKNYRYANLRLIDRELLLQSVIEKVRRLPLG